MERSTKSQADPRHGRGREAAARAVSPDATSPVLDTRPHAIAHQALAQAIRTGGYLAAQRAQLTGMFGRAHPVATGATPGARPPVAQREQTDQAGGSADLLEGKHYKITQPGAMFAADATGAASAELLGGDVYVEVLGQAGPNILMSTPLGPTIVGNWWKVSVKTNKQGKAVALTGKTGWVPSYSLGGSIGLAVTQQGGLGAITEVPILNAQGQKIAAGVATLSTGIQGELPVRESTDLIDLGGQQKSDLFGVSYQGPASEQMHWLQFIWREIIGVHADTSRHPLAGDITTTGGTYKLTANGTPAKDNYNTDAAPGSVTPFYEGSGVHNRTGDSTTIFDLPSAMTHRVEQAFDNGAVSVVSRAHFTTFLVMQTVLGYRVKSVVRLTVEWDFTRATDEPQRQFKSTSAGSAAGLAPKPLKDRFGEQYPHWAAVIP